MARPFEIRSNTSSSIPFLALGALGIVAGFVRGSPGAVSFGVALLLLPLVAAIVLRRIAKKLCVERSAPDSAYEGDVVDVRIRLTNRSRWPVFFPEITEVFHAEIHERKTVLFAERIGPGETLEQSYAGHCLLPRGIYNVGPTALVVSDPFGLFTVRRELKMARKLKVYPRVQDVILRERIGECVSHIVDSMTRPRVGESSETLHVREYRFGDPVRRVHWRLTAHRGFPVVRELAHTSSGDLEVFLDHSRPALAGIGRTSSLEYSVKLTASLAARALRAGHRIGVTVGDDPELSVHPGAGRTHFLALLDRLVQVKPIGETPFIDTLSARSRRLRPGSTVVLTIGSYLYGDARLSTLLRSWRARGLRVVIVLFDTETFQHVWSRSDENPGLSSIDCATEMRRMGLETYLIPCGAQIEHVFVGPIGETRRGDTPGPRPARTRAEGDDRAGRAPARGRSRS